MITTDETKRYFWYFSGILGVVFFWAGIWDGIGGLLYLKNPWVSLIIGLILLSLSKFIFKDANPFGGDSERAIHQVLKKVKNHPEKHQFHIKYVDHILRKEQTLGIKYLKDLEKNFLVFLDKEKEIFIPLHRITAVTHKGKDHWRL